LLIARCALVLAAVVRRFAERRGHGFYLTVVEEIFRAFYAGNAGRYLWDGMKQDITDSFGVADMCGGSRFLDALEGLTRKQGRVTLVGHSAGAIYVCRFLQEVQARGIAPTLAFNIILIAPACDFTLLAKTLQSAGHRIDGFRIFGMSDELERRDAIAPLVYPSSLLYFVSGVIEKPADCPLVGMQRYYNSPYDTVSNFPEIAYVRQHALLANPHTLNWSLTTEGPGYNCDMRSHGGWENAPATVDSIVHIIKSGY
jgi:hypothetical protein